MLAEAPCRYVAGVGERILLALASRDGYASASSYSPVRILLALAIRGRNASVQSLLALASRGSYAPVRVLLAVASRDRRSSELAMCCGSFLALARRLLL